MKFRLSKSVTIKLLLIAAAFFIAPHAVPFAIEFVLMADIMGLEALLLILIYQSRHSLGLLRTKFRTWTNHIGATIILIAGLYFLQPDVFMIQAMGSILLLVLTTSLCLALAIWVPSILFSNEAQRPSYITINPKRTR